jgi:hypothetical protein
MILYYDTFYSFSARLPTLLSEDNASKDYPQAEIIRRQTLQLAGRRAETHRGGRRSTPLGTSSG